MSSSPERHHRIWLGLFLAVGIALRLLGLFSIMLNSDESAVGLMGRHVLLGVFPVFFYGQPFMGGLEALLTAPIFYLLGSSPLTLKLLPVGLSLILLFMNYTFARRLLGPPVALLSTALLAIPPAFFLRWTREARSHYTLVPIFGLILLLLAHQMIYRAPTPRRQAFLLALAGFLSGLAWWTNYLSIVYLLVVWPLLLLHARRLLFGWRLWLAPPAFLLGGLPLWVYQATHGFFLLEQRETITLQYLLPYARDLVTNALPILLGVPVALRWNAFGVTIYAIMGGSYFLAFCWFVWQRRRGLAALLHPSSGETNGSEMLILLVGVTLAINLGTIYGIRLADDDQKYLLPLYTALPTILAGAIATLWQRARSAASTLIAAILALSLAGSLSEGLPVVPPAIRARYLEENRTTSLLLDFLRSRGITRVQGPSIYWTFLSKESTIFADTYQENYPPYAAMVDGSDRAAWMANGPMPEFEAVLRAMGVSYRLIQGPGRWFYHDFHLPPFTYAELQPDGWLATASHRPERAQHAVDRDAGTRWETGIPQAPGMFFQVDLGMPFPVAMLAWLPGRFEDVPGGFDIHLSPDGTNWVRSASVPSYQGLIYWGGTHPIGRVRRGRVEVRFPPLEARYVRITQTADRPEDPHWWTIRELFVFTGTPGLPAEATPVDPLVQALLDRGLTEVVADNGLSARLALASRGRLRVLPANLFTDFYGSSLPDPGILDRFLPTPRTAIVLPLSRSDAASVEADLRQAGFRHSSQDVSGHRIFSRFEREPLPGRPLSRDGWKLSASHAEAELDHLVDGRHSSRWSSGTPQAPGIWLQVELPRAQTVSAISLDQATSLHDYPRGVQIFASEDGFRWIPVRASAIGSGVLRWAGTHLLRDGLETLTLSFPPRPVKVLRLVQTGTDGVFPWSIHELNLLAAP